MRIVVTGYKGFIGQHLVRELKAHGHAVLGLDRDQTDLSQPSAYLNDTLDRFEPHRLVHLAAQVGRLLGEDDMAHTIQSNATMTTLVAIACGRRSIPVLYASTSEAYGDQDGRIAYEEGQDKLPKNLYGLSKRWGEEVLALYAPRRLRIARLSMPYGPGAPPGRGRRALDNMLWQAEHRMPIPVHKGAERSWCHVTDTVRGLRLILERGDAHVHHTYNVGRDDQPTTMLRVAHIACELAGASPDLIDLVDAPTDQTVVKRLNTARLRRLGWSPTIELRDGMAELYDWVRQFDPEGNRLVTAPRSCSPLPGSAPHTSTDTAIP